MNRDFFFNKYVIFGIFSFKQDIILGIFSVYCPMIVPNQDSYYIITNHANHKSWGYIDHYLSIKFGWLIIY